MDATPLPAQQCRALRPEVSDEGERAVDTRASRGALAAAGPARECTHQESASICQVQTIRLRLHAAANVSTAETNVFSSREASCEKSDPMSTWPSACASDGRPQTCRRGEKERRRGHGGLDSSGDMVCSSGGVPHTRGGWGNNQSRSAGLHTALLIHFPHNFVSTQMSSRRSGERKRARCAGRAPTRLGNYGRGVHVNASVNKSVQ